MPDYRYDPLQNNFVTYEAVETPKVEIDMPLMDKPLDISDWSIGVSQTGTPIAQRNLPTATDNNTQMVQPSVDVTYESNPGVTGSKKQAYEFFIGKGLNPHQAAGIVGNLMQESGLKTSIKGDGGKAFGIAQWHPDRQKGLEALAKSLGTSKSDFNTQLEYVWQELNTTEKRALDKLMQAKTVEQATSAFCQHYERPGRAVLESRIKHAKSLLK